MMVWSHNKTENIEPLLLWCATSTTCPLPPKYPEISSPGFPSAPSDFSACVHPTSLAVCVQTPTDAGNSKMISLRKSVSNNLAWYLRVFHTLFTAKQICRKTFWRRCFLCVAIRRETLGKVLFLASGSGVTEFKFNVSESTYVTWFRLLWVWFTLWAENFHRTIT